MFTSGRGSRQYAVTSAMHMRHLDVWVQQPAGGRERLRGVPTDLSEGKLHELLQAHFQAFGLQWVTSGNSIMPFGFQEKNRQALYC